MGVQKNIANLIIASGSFDDVMTIAIFELVSGLIFTDAAGPVSTGMRVWGILASPTFVIVGIFSGWLLSKILVKTMKGSKTFCVIIAVTLPFILIQGTKVFGFESTGPMACMMFGLFCVETESDVFPITAKALDAIWLVLAPAVFALIGCELDFGHMTGVKFLQVFALLILSVSLRTLATFTLVRCDGGYNNKQSLFVAITWLPKATVQAVIGSMALNSVNKIKDQTTASFKMQKTAAQDILSMAVLSILVTAPIGGFLMRYTSGPLLKESPGLVEEISDAPTEEHGEDENLIRN